MQAWAVVENGVPLEKIEKPTPVPAGTEVLVEVTHCGVCHSDLHFWEGYYDLGSGKRMLLRDRGVTLPRAIGHEILGRVAKLGPDAEGVAVGDRRIVYPWVGCGHCRRCRVGEDNLCVAQRSLGVMQDGGFGSHVVVPHARYLVDPGDVDPAVAATFGCSGITVLNGIRKVMPLEPSDPIVLVGAGGLGLAAIGMLRALGHEAIVSIDISAEKRAAASAAGATAVVDGNGPDVTAAILAAAGGPVLGAIDFVNGSATARFIHDALAKGGRMVQVGVFGGELNVSLIGLIFRSTAIMGSVTGSVGDLHEVARLARQGKLAPIPVTLLGRDEANEALMRLRDGRVTGRLVLVAEGVG
jgi:alcohol dehydrogenase/propanol-preferring alcohol dehydrogenase